MSPRAAFDRHADAWEAWCRAASDQSRADVYVDHPDLHAIVALGDVAVPWIIERYRAGPLFWGAALARITGDASRGDGATGDLKATRRAWLSWFDAPRP